MRWLIKKINSPIGTGILIINIAVLVTIKFWLPFGTSQFGALIEQVREFSSRDIIAETNQIRASYNVEPLKTSPALDLAAADKLQDMTDKGYFAHISPMGVTPWTWMIMNHYNYSIAGENLAIGFPSADAVVTAWVNSPSHRDNIVNPKYSDIGVAVGYAKLGISEGVLVVQMFGSTPQTSTISKIPTTPNIPVSVVIAPETLPNQSTLGVSISKTQPIIFNNDTETHLSASPVNTDKSYGWVEGVADFLPIYFFAVAAFLLILTLFYEPDKAAYTVAFFHIALFLISMMAPSIELNLSRLIL